MSGNRGYLTSIRLEAGYAFEKADVEMAILPETQGTSAVVASILDSRR